MLKQIGITAALSFTPFSGFADSCGEPVNCSQQVVSQQNIYQGTAACEALHIYTTWVDKKLEHREARKVLSRHFDETTESSARLTGIVRFTTHSYFGIPQENTTGVWCDAPIPFSHQEDVLEQVCEYTPEAKFSAYPIYDGYYLAGINVRPRGCDRDGSIVKEEYWLDGRYYGGSFPIHWTTQRTEYEVKYKVTDNDGYTHEATKSVIVDPAEGPCRQNPNDTGACMIQ